MRMTDSGADSEKIEKIKYTTVQFILKWAFLSFNLMLAAHK